LAEQLDPQELVSFKELLMANSSFKELLMANSMQVDALAQILIEKGIITKEEFFDKLKQVQSQYQSNTDA